MHKTDAGERAKALKKEAAAIIRKARSPVMGLQGLANSRLAQAQALKPEARLEDLNLWQMEKVKSTKKDSKTYLYWMASWREGGKVRNVHLGSCRKVDHETALQKARALKAEALGLYEN